MRLNSPISLTVTFSRPVSGLAIEGIIVVNGAASNFAGSGAVYTFDVTPNAIGEVTVEISAGAAEDADGNGNKAAPLFLWASHMTITATGTSAKLRPSLP